MTMVSVSMDLRALEQDLPLYAKLARKTMREAVIKQGAKVLWAWSEGLTEYTPEKGAIRHEIMAGFKAGRGISIRPSAYRKADEQLGRRKGAYTDLVSKRIMRKVKGDEKVLLLKGLNRQAIAAKIEIGMRERARGFSAYGARASMTKEFGIWADQIAAKEYGGTWNKVVKGAKGQTLSVTRVVAAAIGDRIGMKIVFGSAQTELGEILVKSRQQAKLSQAISATHEDMMVYVRDRLAKAKADPSSKYALALKT